MKVLGRHLKVGDLIKGHWEVYDDGHGVIKKTWRPEFHGYTTAVTGLHPPFERYPEGLGHIQNFPSSGAYSVRFDVEYEVEDNVTTRMLMRADYMDHQTEDDTLDFPPLEEFHYTKTPEGRYMVGHEPTGLAVEVPNPGTSEHLLRLMGIRLLTKEIMKRKCSIPLHKLGESCHIRKY